LFKGPRISSIGSIVSVGVTLVDAGAGVGEFVGGKLVGSVGAGIAVGAGVLGVISRVASGMIVTTGCVGIITCNFATFGLVLFVIDSLEMLVTHPIDAGTNSIIIMIKNTNLRL
tara:strand:- start:3222 stop:3563 length:342 start_codon:yes stop_codon:yes gene_type:complete